MAVGKFRSRLDERLLTGPREDISKEEMDKWAEEAALAPSVQLGAAGDFGTDAHTLFETLLTSDRPADVPVKPRFRIVVDNFLDWKKTVPSLEVIENEMVVYSLKNEYAGAVDAVCKVEDKLVIMDWKTSNQMHVEYAMQVSAYARAYEEMTGATVQEAWVVRFDKLARKPPQIKVVKVEFVSLRFFFLWLILAVGFASGARVVFGGEKAVDFFADFDIKALSLNCLYLIYALLHNLIQNHSFFSPLLFLSLALSGLLRAPHFFLCRNRIFPFPTTAENRPTQAPLRLCVPRTAPRWSPSLAQHLPPAPARKKK